MSLAGRRFCIRTSVPCVGSGFRWPRKVFRRTPAVVALPNVLGPPRHLTMVSGGSEDDRSAFCLPAREGLVHEPHDVSAGHIAHEVSVLDCEDRTEAIDGTVRDKSFADHED